jgi:hypothetical protein
MLTCLYETIVPAHPHMEQLFGQPVCNHVFMQKTVESLGFRETGIEVALMPAEAFNREKSAAGRVATLNTFRCYVPKPHRIFLPGPYEAILRRIYDRLGDGRDFAPCRKIRGGEKTQSEGAFFDFAGVARFGFLKIGADFADRLNELEAQARSKGMVVSQASLNMNDACVGEAVDILRERGYFFGGPLPRWFDTDGLLMQKLDCPPDFEGIVLGSDFAKELLAFIREDRERVR